MRIHYRSTCCWAALLLAFAGCGGSGPELAPVSGRVTLDGKPLQQADVVFQPEGAKRPSYGRTDADGRYELYYQQGSRGALVGSHGVRIAEIPSITKRPDRVPPDLDLKCEVKSGEDNVFDFTLKSETQ